MIWNAIFNNQITNQLSYNNFWLSPYFNMCPSHLATYGTSGTIWTMAITDQEISRMLWKFGSRVIHSCRFQIYSQISHISDTFVDIRFLRLNYSVTRWNWENVWVSFSCKVISYCLKLTTYKTNMTRLLYPLVLNLLAFTFLFFTKLTFSSRTPNTISKIQLKCFPRLDWQLSQAPQGS